jgi:hypothetical protein
MSTSSEHGEDRDEGVGVEAEETGAGEGVLAAEDGESDDEFGWAEVEKEDTSAEISRPFDPNKIQVRLWTPTIDLLMKRIAQGEIDLAPEFQRKAGIWKEKAQSQLIESLLIRLPLPAFFIDGIDEDQFAVIDGIQRLTALKRFVLDGALRLVGLEFLKDLIGKTFVELPRKLQRRIEETMVTVNIIEKGTPEEAKLNLFKRINTGGLALTAQEIRHAINPGPVRGFLKELAESDDFLKATSRSVNTDRMDDRECVLRSLAFVLTPPEQYPAQQDFDWFLNMAMKNLNVMTPEQRAELGRRFRRSMQAASTILGNKSFRKLLRDRRSPINKALFESWSVNLDACPDKELAELALRRDVVVDRFIHLLRDSSDFEMALSQGTGDRSKVLLRFREIRALLQGVLA